MEDLSKILTDLAEQELKKYEEEELDLLVTACNNCRTEHECNEVYRVALAALTSACLGFTHGLGFLGSTVDTEHLNKKICDILSDFGGTYFDYLTRFRK